MTKLVSVTPSHVSGKKYDAHFVSDSGREKTVPFGAKGMDDYTITHDQEQRARYRQRHQKDLQTNDPTRPGYLSYYLLWGAAPSLRANLQSYRSRFHL
jgi:hypothetical protein